MIKTYKILKRYILSEVKPPPVGVVAALEILTRLARHSQEVALNIACTPNLLKIIVKNFLPISTQKLTCENTNDVYGCPLVSALRLCRILIVYAGRPVADRLNNLKITHSLLAYLSSETGKEGIRLNLESIRLWKVLLNHGNALDSIHGARIVLISKLRLLQDNLNLNEASEYYCEYAGALITISILDQPLREHITLLLTKWSTQLARISFPTWARTSLVAQVLKALGDTSSMQTEWINNSKIFNTLCSSSNLLSGLKISAEREPTSLPSLGVLAEQGHLQPVMSPFSFMVFLSTVLKLFVRESRTAEIQAIFGNSDFRAYLRNLETSEWSLERSWYSRIEYTLLIAIINAEELLSSTSKTETSYSVWKIAIKLISALPADKQDDMKIVLNHAFNQERLSEGYLNSKLQDLALSETEKREFDTNDSSFMNPTLFAKFLSCKGSQFDAALPKDWLYLPLVDAYSRLKEDGSWTSTDVQNITTLLKLESLMPELTENLSPSLRFSRLVLLYLCDASFIHSPLAAKAFTKLLQKYHHKLDFSAKVPGLNSFTDLFTTLCENFSGHSYGEDNFAAVLLVFAAQRHDVHYRKLLWSEHAGALYFCRLTMDKLLIPIKEYFYPVETDDSLVESYITALVRKMIKKNVSPLLYDIAVHHSAMYLKGTTGLAAISRSRLQKLKGHDNLVKELLHYEPVILDKHASKKI